MMPSRSSRSTRWISVLAEIFSRLAISLLEARAFLMSSSTMRLSRSSGSFRLFSPKWACNWCIYTTQKEYLLSFSNLSSSEILMLDIRLIREEPERVRGAILNRHQEAPIESLINKDLEWRRILQQVEELRKSRNAISKEINQMLKDGKDAAPKLKEAKEIPDKIKALEEKLRVIES